MRRIIFLFLLLSLCPVCAFAAAPPSSVNLSVESTTADLAAIINRNLPKELYKGKGELGAAITLLRTGPATLTASDNFVHLALPVQLTLGYGLYESPPLRAEMRFKARVSVAPDWRIRTELYYTGLSDTLADSFKLGPLSLKPRAMLEGITQPLQRLLAPIIDAKVNDALQLRTRIASYWQGAFTPILVSKEFSAWLQLTPDRIVMSPVTAADNRIRLSIGIMTGAAVTVGPKPAATTPKPLPPLQTLPAFDRHFHIQLATDIFFADLVTALNPVLLDKSFGEEKKITVKSFRLKGEEGRLMVVLTSSGAFDGEITVLARPVYNPGSNTLTFEDVDFDTRNAGWLVSVGGWLFKSGIKGIIKSKLDTAVVEQLEKARQKASATLSSVRLADQVSLSGTVASLSLGEAAVRDDRLSIGVIVQGEMGVSLR